MKNLIHIIIIIIFKKPRTRNLLYNTLFLKHFSKYNKKLKIMYNV